MCYNKKRIFWMRVKFMGNTEKEAKPKKKKSIISTIVLIIAIIVFVGSGIMLIKIFTEYKGAVDEYKELEKQYVTTDEEGLPDVDLAALKELNSDVIGWIRFENINIDYPIVIGKDNDYYLHHTFKKESNSSGAIFMDYRNNPNFEDQNSVIYGHNMKNKSMFALLNEYKSEEYFKENPGFYIIDDTGSHYYKIYSCYACNVIEQEDHYTIKFGNDKKFQQYIDKIKKCSKYDTGVTPTVDDKLVMLSTCMGDDDYRFVVHAVKVS